MPNICETKLRCTGNVLTCEGTAWSPYQEISVDRYCTVGWLDEVWSPAPRPCLTIAQKYFSKFFLFLSSYVTSISICYKDHIHVYDLPYLIGKPLAKTLIGWLVGVVVPLLAQTLQENIPAK